MKGQKLFRGKDRTVCVEDHPHWKDTNQSLDSEANAGTLILYITRKGVSQNQCWLAKRIFVPRVTESSVVLPRNKKEHFDAPLSFNNSKFRWREKRWPTQTLFNSLPVAWRVLLLWISMIQKNVWSNTEYGTYSKHSVHPGQHAGVHRISCEHDIECEALGDFYNTPDITRAVYNKGP